MLKHRLDVASDAQLAARTLSLNEIGVVNLSTAEPIVFEPYAVNRTLGGFILIDPLTFETIGAGMINFALRRASNTIGSTEVRARRGRPRNCSSRCVWLTGLPIGQSTIANRLEQCPLRRPPHISPRRRQRPPRSQSRSWLHRSGSRREYPPRR
jgi:bifunctional enzyme CysN/CysC